MYIYNPLLKDNLQKATSGAASVVSNVSQIQNLKIGAIFQYLGETTNELTKGYFYIKKGEPVTIPAGYYWLNVDTGEHYYLTKIYTTEESRLFDKTIPVDYETANDNKEYYKIISYYSTQSDVDKIKNALIPRQEDGKWFKASEINFNNSDYIITNIILTNGARYTPTRGFAGAKVYGEYTCAETGQIYYSSVETVNNAPLIIANVNNIYMSNYLFAVEPIGDAFAGSRQYTETEIIFLNVEQINVQPQLNGITSENGKLKISVDTDFEGDVTIQGTQTTVITQEINSENDNINLRYNNPLALADNETSGLNINNYDGNGNNLNLVVDNEGWAMVGNDDSLQRLATIDTPSANAIPYYDATEKTLKANTAGIADFWKGTQAQYNAITTKDNNTIYIII